jgi:phosphatidylethanolamine-binding protein (PEBP) family uncharacterized protein
VAQRTGAERFLAPTAKSASAGLILALALAVLLLAGCGGGSSDPEGSSAASASDPAEATGGGGDVAAQKAGSEGSAKADPARSGSSSSAVAGSAGEDAPAKHGRRIAQPKGAPEQAPTPAQIAHATVASMRLESPAMVASEGHLGRLSPTYTCDGKGTWPALHWGGVPEGTAELVLFAMNLQPLEGKIFFDWAVAGLDPGLQGIDSATLPKGAVLGTNGFGKRGYEICPSGAGETYMFALYALPSALAPRAGFDPLALREEVLGRSGNVGLLPAVYERG